MADGDGGVGVHEQKRHGFADDVAAAEDHGVRAFDRNIIAAQNFHAAGGRTRDEAGSAADQTTEIYGMKAVDVFCGIDSFENALGVDLGREGKLNENPVHSVVIVQLLDEAQHLVGGDGGGRCVHPTGETELLARGDFGFDVELRGGILAYEDGRQAWANAFAGQARDFAFQFSEDFVADFGSIKEPCGHLLLTFVLKQLKNQE
jgi:hypothetical protein